MALACLLAAPASALADVPSPPRTTKAATKAAKPAARTTKPAAPTATKAAKPAARAAKAVAKVAKPAAYVEKAFVHKSYDGFKLPAKWMLPKGKTLKNVGRVVILIHGSGPQSMDLDLTKATKGGKKNLVFFDMSKALVKRGFGVLRYDKRTYVLNRAFANKNPKAMTMLKAFRKKPLSSLVNDVKSLAAMVKKQSPKAQITLLGVSQGTYVGLQAAHKNPHIANVGLIGFYTGSMLLSLGYVQLLYRPIMLLRKYDTNNDGHLDGKEMAKAGKIGISLGMQMALLDVNKDQKLSWVEIQGGNMLNLFAMMGRTSKKFFIEEATYPSVVKILGQARFKVAFFQGMLDNQTPASHTIAVKHVNDLRWKKKTMQFHFFPKLGHALDPRTGYYDLYFSKMSPKALTKVCDVMNASFK